MLARASIVLASTVALCACRKPSAEVRPDPIDAVAVSPAPSPPPAKWSVTLERTRCYGACPAYVVSVDQDGHVAYEGESFVAAFGKRTSNVPSAAAVNLYARAKALHFETLKPRYAVPCTDHPSAFITFQTGADAPIRVEDYGAGSQCGGGSGAPPAFYALEDEIDRVAQTKAWTTCRDAAGAETECDRDGDASP